MRRLLNRTISAINAAVISRLRSPTGTAHSRLRSLIRHSPAPDSRTIKMRLTHCALLNGTY